MIHPINHLPAVIRVGIQTESGVEEIGFDLSPWLTRWPGMTCAVWPTRPGESAAYPAANVEMVGNVLYWYPSSADTEKEGAGTVEVVGVVADKCKSTGPIDTLVKKTSLDVTQETPEPIVPWFEELQKTGGIAQQGAADAAASAAEAAEKAAEAGQHAATAGQHASNADAQAQAAKGHADAAAASAENAEKAKQTAIDNADDAEEAAKSARTSAQTAATSAAAAKQSETAAAESATKASESARAAATSAQEIEDSVDVGEGGLYLVNAVGGTADRTQEEIYAASDAGKMCLLVADDGMVYVGQGKGTHPLGEVAPMFIAPIKRKSSNGEYQYHQAFVLSDGEVSTSFMRLTAPNPYKLTIGEQTYDGSEAASVEIPDVLIVKKTIGEDGYICADKTPEEIEAAVASGKACIMVRDNRVYTYIGVTKNQANSQYGECHTFADVYSEQGGIRWACQYVSADGRIQGFGNIAKTPNPYSLTIKQGDKTTEYNGSSSVQVEIPQGGGGTAAAVQSDWLQMNEVAPDYVRNRTHYAIEAYATPRPIPEPLVKAEVTGGKKRETLVKATGYVLPLEKFLECNPHHDYGGNQWDSIDESNIAAATEDGYIIVREVSGGGFYIFAIVCLRAGYTFTADFAVNNAGSVITCPEPGIYVIANDDGTSPIRVSWGDYIQTLDEKYIPDTIARKSDIPEIPEIPEPVTDEHIYSLIDNKMNSFGRQIIFSAFGLSTIGQALISTPWAADIVAGKKYTVIYNGQSYTYDAVALAAASGAMLIGNGKGYGMTDINPDAPFAIASFPNATGEQTGVYGGLTVYDGAETADITILVAAAGYYYYDGEKTHIVTVGKLRRELGLAGGATILPESTVVDVEGELAIVTPWKSDIIAGNVYTVTYNGTAYECTAVAIPAEVIGVQGVTLLGNVEAAEALGLSGGNPDAPFMLCCYPSALGAEIGAYAAVVPLDGSSSVTLSIVEAGGAADSGGAALVVKASISGTSMSALTVDSVSETHATMYAAIMGGRDVLCLASHPPVTNMSSSDVDITILRLVKIQHGNNTLVFSCKTVMNSGQELVLAVDAENQATAMLTS